MVISSNGYADFTTLPRLEHPPGRPDDEQEPFDHQLLRSVTGRELNTVLFDRYKKSLRILRG